MEDNKFLTQPILDAFIDIYFATLIIRHPNVHPCLETSTPGVQIESSYIKNGEKQDLCIQTLEMIKSYKEEGFDSPQNLRNSFNQINSMFLISMWALLCEKSKFNDIRNRPDVQFFRHVRNASAHSNTFNYSQLNIEAVWRDKRLSMDLSGTKLFPDYLKDADPFLLILDINNNYFERIEFGKYF